MGLVGNVAGEVTADVERVRHGVAYLTEDLPVFVVPAVVPLCTPVVLHAQVNLVVPEEVKVQLGEHQTCLAGLCIVEVQLRLSLAGYHDDEQQGRQGDEEECFSHLAVLLSWVL